MSSTDQIMRGIVNYIDSEVMSKLPASNRWLVGTMVVLANNKTANVVESLKENSLVKAFGIVDDSGNVDVDALITAMKESINRYGNIVIDIPAVCKLTFDSHDLDRLEAYIN